MCFTLSCHGTKALKWTPTPTFSATLLTCTGFKFSFIWHNTGILLQFLQQYQEFLSTCGACSEVVFEFEWRPTYFGLVRAKLILAPLGMLIWVRPSISRYRMFFIQTSTLLPSMQNMDCVVCKTTQLPTKSHVELEDDSNIVGLFLCCHPLLLQILTLYRTL